MPLFSNRVKSMALVACLAIGVGAPAAVASVDLQLEWWIDGALAGSYGVSGTDNGNGTFNYAGNLVYLNPANPFEVVNLAYNLNGKPDANTGLNNNILLSGNLAVENLFTENIEVQLLVQLPVLSPAPGTEMGGSAAIGLTTNADGGTVASVDGMPVWQALTDGTPVGETAALFFDPFFLSNAGPGSNATSGNFGLPPNPPVDGGPIASTMGIDINFSLTPSDQTSITSVLNAFPIPAPGTLIVVAAMGLVTRRRRR